VPALGSRVGCVVGSSSINELDRRRNMRLLMPMCGVPHDGVVATDEGMNLSDVLEVLDAVRSLGCRFWLEGGWGVDALVGRQTRPHRDVDVDFDAAFEGALLEVLAGLGYSVETDWRPNRVELAAPGRRWVDLHPLVIDDDGNARQAALDGGWHEFDRSWFTSGTLAGEPVPCVSVEAQLLFHTGYELRTVDLLDLAELDRLASER
jgi:lincosamide nucleotidyltransferase A/C/D/E